MFALTPSLGRIFPLLSEHEVQRGSSGTCWLSLSSHPFTHSDLRIVVRTFRVDVLRLIGILYAPLRRHRSIRRCRTGPSPLSPDPKGARSRGTQQCLRRGVQSVRDVLFSYLVPNGDAIVRINGGYVLAFFMYIYSKRD
jgi:hypothetical protein